MPESGFLCAGAENGRKYVVPARDGLLHFRSEYYHIPDLRNILVMPPCFYLNYYQENKEDFL